MDTKKKLGDVLKEAGLIDDFQLESALSYQRNWGGKLGSIMVELQFVKEQDLAKALADKLHLPYVDLFNPEIPGEIVSLIKADVARKYHVMPVRKEEKSLVLAMSDPMDLEAMDSIRFATGCNIKPALAMVSEIEDAIKKYYEHEEVRKAPADLRKTPGKMELIHGSELQMEKAARLAKGSQLLAADETVQQMQVDNKVRLDALITLLIEKGLITREELVSMVYQKKMGL